MISSHFKFTIFLLAVMLLPTAAHACTPIPELMFAIIGPAPIAALAFKSFTALLVVVLIKSVLFAYISDSKHTTSFFLMIIANIFSTLPGIIGVFIVSVPVFLIFTIPALFFPYKYLAGYIIESVKKVRYLSFFNTEIRIAAALSIATFISVFFFFAAQSVIDTNLQFYWAFKIGYTTLGVITGLFITVACETAFIHGMLEKKDPDGKSYLYPVVWANVWAMFISVGISAAVILPQRFVSKNFLAWLAKVFLKV